MPGSLVEKFDTGKGRSWDVSQTCERALFLLGRLGAYELRVEGR
jgi:hypothetical protein